MRTGSYSLEPARSYPPEARRSSSERSSALRPPGERSRPSQREFPKPVREQQPDSSAPELPLLAEMCNTGSQLVKKSRALFPAPKAGLHCGGTHAAPPLQRRVAFPSSKSWAPLRVVVLQRLDLRLRLYIMANRPLWLLIFSTVDINSTFLLCYKLVCRRLGGLFC